MSGKRVRRRCEALSGPGRLRLGARGAGLTVVAALLALTADPAAAQTAPGSAIEVLHVRGPIYLITAGGTNVTASIGPDGVLLVDTGPTELAAEVRATVDAIQGELAAAPRAPLVGGAETISRTLALFTPPAPAGADSIRYVINTSALPNRIGGNAELAIAPREMSFQDPSEIATAIYAHENVLLRVSGAVDEGTTMPFEFWPSHTYVDQYKLPYFNGEGIQLIHIPSASTDGDTLVWFRGSDVISAGDVYRTDTYPIPHIEIGGDIGGVIEGLNVLVDLSIAEYRAEGGTLIIPGRGRISDVADVAAYRDMVTIIRDRVQSMIDAGRSLRQIKAALPHRDYDVRYAKEPGVADRFTDALYSSLAAGKEAAH